MEENMKALQRLLPILACPLLVSLTGCHSQPDAGLPALPSVSVSPAEQSQMEQLAQRYVASLQSQDVSKAEALMSPGFRAATPPARLKTLLQGSYQPLVGAKAFQFDPITLMAHSPSLVLHARFVGGNGKAYRTNFLLVKSGAVWQVSGLIPPAAHQVPKLRQSHASAA